MSVRRPSGMGLAAAALLLGCVVICATTQAVAADARSLLRSSVPGAFGVRYLPDRAVLTYTVEPPAPENDEPDLSISLYLPQPIRWGYLDRAPLKPPQYAWNPEAQQVELTVPLGSHRLHLGWAGSGKLPPEDVTIPVKAEGETVGVLRARFDLTSMEAGGSARLGPAQASVRLKLAADLDPESVSLTCGQETVRRWSKGESVLAALGAVLLPESPRLTLRVDQYALDASPIKEVVFDRLRPPTRAVHVQGDVIPDDAMLVEAEAFADSGGTPVQVDPGSHHDEHGGASVFSFQGDGAWLEWVLEVPAEGLYDLYARIACADDLSFRSVRVDGSVPQGLGLVQFPGTGGWAHAPGEWWLMKIAGAGEEAPPLALEAGEHRIRFTGVLEHHLNVDYVLLAPHR